MTKALVLTFAAVFSLAGCGGSSNVVPAGGDSFVVSAGGGIYEQSGVSIREEVYSKANAHCSRMARKMEVVDVTERPYAIGKHTADIQLTFAGK